MEREKNILDHFAVIVRWRRMVFTSVFTVCLITAGISLILPKAYRAQAVVYPPRESQEMFGLSTLLGNLPMGLLGMGEGTVSATDFVPVLKSERVAGAIIRRFNLKERYEPETREELYDMVAKRLGVELTREQFLRVSYEAETPEFAAEITNAFVEELDRALQERRKEQSESLRVYLEKRLAVAEQDMLEAEQAYNRFQQEHMAIDLETQAKAQIESASNLFTIVGEMFIEREIAAKLMVPDHAKLKQLDLKLEGAREALDRILMGQPRPGGGDMVRDGELPEVFIPFREVPKLGLEALSLLRDVEIQNAIYKFLFQEYEQARFEEGKSTPLVTVLDKAVPPDTRSRPRRTVMVAIAGGLSLAISVLLAFLFEALGGLEGENREKLDAILRDLRLKR